MPQALTFLWAGLLLRLLPRRLPQRLRIDVWGLFWALSDLLL
jgi:hypothetical protein